MTFFLPKVLERAEQELLSCHTTNSVVTLMNNRFARLKEKVKSLGGVISPRFSLNVTVPEIKLGKLARINHFGVNRGLISEQINIEEEVLIIPKEYILSPELFKEIPHAEVMLLRAQSDNNEISDVYKFIFGLAYQFHLGEKSRFVEYFELLPSLPAYNEHPISVYMRSNDQEGLFKEWYDIHPSLAKLIKNRADKYIFIKNRAKLLNDKYNIVESGLVTPELLTLYCMWICTRSWVGNIMVPIADLCQHSAEEDNIIVFEPGKGCNMKINREIKSGTSVTINYRMNDCNIIYSTFGFIEGENWTLSPGNYEGRFASTPKTLTVFNFELAEVTENDKFIKKCINDIQNNSFYPGVLIGTEDIYLGTLIYLRALTMNESDIAVVRARISAQNSNQPICQPPTFLQIGLDNECRALKLLLQIINKMDTLLGPEKVKNARILLSKRAPTSVEYKMAALVLISAEIQKKTKESIHTYWSNFLT